VGSGVSVSLDECEGDAERDVDAEVLSDAVRDVDPESDDEPLVESDVECDPEVENVDDGVGVGGGVMVWLGEPDMDGDVESLWEVLSDGLPDPLLESE